MQLRQALDQLSASYAEVQGKLREREAALQKLTSSLAIARTESELFERLWTEAQVRVQTLGVNLAEPDATVTQRQLVETLQRLYRAESDRQQLANVLQRLVTGLASNQDVAGLIATGKQVLGGKPVATEPPTHGSALAGARVLEVNPKLRLVVLDIGTQQGARVGMPMMILRGDRVVAAVRIVEVRQNICGALMENVENNITLQAGDTARVTKS